MLKNLAGETLPVMWTVTPDTDNNLYSIYLDGQLYRSHMDFDTFYPLYRELIRKRDKCTA
jgi:tricorn protease-like protein